MSGYEESQSNVQFNAPGSNNEGTGLLEPRSVGGQSRRISILSFPLLSPAEGHLSEEEELQRKKEKQEQQLRRHRNSVFGVIDPSSSNIPKSHSKAQRHKIQHKTHYKRDVEYDGENHFSILFQLYGSVWPAVLPWCLTVLVVTGAVWYLRQNHIVDLTISSNTGHTFMSILVSFLIVTRTTITYNRFMEARQHLADLYRSSREIVQYTCLLTNQNVSDEAKRWRSEVAYKTIVALRVAVAALEYRSKGVNTWEVIPEEDHENTELMVEHDNGPASPRTPITRDESSIGAEYKPATDHFSVLRTLAHGPRSRIDENFRAPIVWAYNLREASMYHLF